MHFRQLETFISVYETKNFGATARSLFVSQPAVSQQLRTLEEEVGFPLFYRSRHSVTPTPQGETFYPYACRLLSLQREALSALRPDAPDFHLHFVAGDLQDPIRKVQLRFYAENPDVRVEILAPVPKERYSDAALLLPRHLYIARRGWITDDRIRFYPLGPARYSALLYAGDPLAGKDAIGFPDVQDKLFAVLAAPVMHGAFMSVMRAEIRRHVPADRILPCSDQLHALSQVISGKGGCVFILPFFVQSPPEPGIRRLRFLSGDEEGPVGLAFVGQPTAAMSRFIRAADGCYDEETALERDGS